jgi:hypothetical protein
MVSIGICGTQDIGVNDSGLQAAVSWDLRRAIASIMLVLSPSSSPKKSRGQFLMLPYSLSRNSVSFEAPFFISQK